MDRCRKWTVKYLFTVWLAGRLTVALGTAVETGRGPSTSIGLAGATAGPRVTSNPANPARPNIWRKR